MVAATVQAAVQSVLSLIEVRELTDDKHIRCLRSYRKTVSPIGNVFDVLWIRDVVPDNLVPAIKSALGKQRSVDKETLIDRLLKDYVAYLDISQVFHEPDLKGESITVSSAAWTGSGNEIQVKAIYDPTDKCRPVLRAYAQGRHTVLNYNDGAYSGTIQRVSKIDATVVHVIARELAHGSKTVA